MAGRYPRTDYLTWKPVPTALPRDWLEFINKGRDQHEQSPPHAYVLAVRYNAPRVGDLLRSWGLPWQVVVAGYLWGNDKQQIRATQLSDTDTVLNHMNEANTYARHIEDENLLPLLSPPYRDIGGLLIAVAMYFQALQDLRQQSNQQPYTGETLSHIKSVGYTLTNVATRLSMWHFKRDIEDLVEQLSNPQKFYTYDQQYLQILKRDGYMLEATRQLFMATYQEATQQNIVVLQLPCAVTGMNRRLQDASTTTSQKTHPSGFHLVTFELLVSTVGECYAAFGILNQLGYIQDRVTDLIANPKPNGCSHIAFGLILKPEGPRTRELPWLQTQSRTCQIQIATHVMHAIDWYGCLYPDYYQLCMQNTSPQYTELLSGQQFWASQNGKAFYTLRDKFTVISSHTDAAIVVYNRNRDPVPLPKKATALDFAYAVDPEIGEHAVEAFVNSRKASLFRELEAGDIVEIRTTKEIQVQDYWLQDNYAVTQSARTAIKTALEQLPLYQRNYRLLLQELERNHYKLTPEALDTELYNVLQQHNLGTPQAYLAQLDGNSEPPYTSDWAVQSIIEQMAQNNVAVATDKNRSNWTPVLDMPPTAQKKPFRKQRFCDFCQPGHPRDLKIMGQFKDRSGELVVHKESCPHLIDQTVGRDSVLLPMLWQLHYPACRVTFFILGHDRKGFILDIARQLRRHLCYFHSIHGDAIRGEAWVRVSIDTDTDTEALDIWQELYQVEGVTKVEVDAAHTPVTLRTHLQQLYDKRNHMPPEESPLDIWTELLPIPLPRNTILKNPFDISRPATAKMFFGRAQETRIMQRELCEGERGRALVLYGPLRSGKTSICKNFLEFEVSPPLWGTFFSLQNSTWQTADVILAKLLAEIRAQFAEQLKQVNLDASETLDRDQQTHFRHSLRDCLAQMPGTRLILVLDEFGGALDAYERRILDYHFFTYWKELMDEIPQISLIFALPTSSHNLLVREFSHVFSFAETLPVAFLDAESAGQLLVDPLSDLHILIRQHTVAFATKLTGGNPYYMTLIGQRLIRQLNRDKAKQLITDDDLSLVVDQLIEEGSQQNFDFLRRELQCKEEFLILQAIVESSSNRTPKVQLRKIAERLNLPISLVKQHLDRLRIGLILEEIGPAPNPFYSFKIELVRRWLARNSWFFAGAK